MTKYLVVPLVCTIMLVLASIPASGLSINHGVSADIRGSNSVAGYNANSETKVIATGTIQAAINDVKTPDDANFKILLEPRTYYETGIDIRKSLQLIGARKGNTVVDGGGYGPIFTIEPTKTVTLEGMTIQNGHNGNGDYSSGGGIHNDGTLTLDHVLVTGCYAGLGGGIFNDGTLKMKDVQITNNNALWGAGVFNDATGYFGNAKIGVTNMQSGSSIYGNTALWGGGVYNYDGTFNMQSGSSIYDNTANDGGGGVYNGAVNIHGARFSTATFNMNSGCSIYGNQVPYGMGGGIYNAGSDLGSAAIVNMNKGSSITGNTAWYGGGVYNQRYLGAARLNQNKGSSITGNSPDQVYSTP